MNEHFNMTFKNNPELWEFIYSNISEPNPSLNTARGKIVFFNRAGCNGI